MKRMRFVAAVVALSAAVAVPLAYSAGLWFGLPVVGGLSYCSGTTTAGTPGTTAVCNSTVPAGPTSTTGYELVPADTNSQGTQAAWPDPGTNVSSNPQTAYLPLATVASGAYLLTQPTGLVNMTLTVPNGITNVVQNLTGAMTTYGLILPLTPTDGQLVRFTANATITSIFVTASGLSGQSTVTSVDTPTQFRTYAIGGAAPGTSITTGAVINGFAYLYNLSNNKWFRLQ